MDIKKMLAIAMIGATVMTGVGAMPFPVYAESRGAAISTTATTTKEQIVNENVTWYIDDELVSFDSYLNGNYAVGVGQKITITPTKAFGTVKGNTYKLYVKTTSAKSWSLVTKGTYTNYNSINYTTTKAGKYQICLKMTDKATGTINKQYWTITIKDTPKSGTIDILSAEKFNTSGEFNATSIELRSLGYSSNYGLFKAVEVYRREAGSSTWNRIYRNTDTTYKYKCNIKLDFDKVGVYDYCVKLYNQAGNTYKTYLNGVKVKEQKVFEDTSYPEEVLTEIDGLIYIYKDDIEDFVPVRYTVSATDTTYKGVKYTTYDDFKKNGSKATWVKDNKLGTKAGNYVIDYSKSYDTYTIHQYLTYSFMEAVDFVDVYDIWKDARKQYGVTDILDNYETYTDEEYTVAKNFENVPVEDMYILCDNISEAMYDNTTIFNSATYGSPFAIQDLMSIYNIREWLSDYHSNNRTNGVYTEHIKVTKVSVTDHFTGETVTITEDTAYDDVNAELYYAGVYDFDITYELSDGVERTIKYQNVPITFAGDRWF